MRRIALRLGAVAIVVLVVTAWLVTRALGGVHREDAARHAAVVEDLFDELERELSELVDREERRSFLEYRHLYVPEGVASAGLVRSPLADVPEDPSVVGYFQLDPGNDLTNPALPRDNELDAALASGWSRSDELDARQREIRRIVSQIPSWEIPTEPVAQVQEQQAQAPRVQLKRGSSGRGTRIDKMVSTKGVSVEAYNTKEDVLQNLWDANAAFFRNPDAAPVVEEVDVRLSPIEGLRVGDHLVLHREVRIGRQRHRQGLILDLERLAERLEDDVLGGSDLDPFVTLAWDAEPRPAAYTFEHAFAVPFQTWRVAASVSPIPELGSSEAWFLGGLAALVLVVVVVGGAGVWRAVRAELELAQRRSDFAAAVTHELKTPLTTIRMYGEMLRDGIVTGEERQREYHTTLVAEAERLTRLIGNVLELARIERGAAGPVAEALDPAALAREAHELCEPMVRAGGATLELLVADDLPRILVERDGLVQALSNLVENALKFSADAADRRIHLEVSREGAGVAFRVRDHGPGVPRGQLRQIFEPFYRGERELTRRTKGTGIGLALVEGVVGRAGGTVRARNHPDGGLEVTLEIEAISRQTSAVRKAANR